MDKLTGTFFDISSGFHVDAELQYNGVVDDELLKAEIGQHFSDFKYDSSHGYHNKRSNMRPTSRMVCGTESHQISMFMEHINLMMRFWVRFWYKRK